MGGHGAVEVAKTVLEVADVAWTAMECCHHHRHDSHHDRDQETHIASEEQQSESLRSENQRLRNLLEQNLKLLQNLSESPCLLNDYPPDLYARLVATVGSKGFLSRLEYFQHSTKVEFPFKEATAMAKALHGVSKFEKVINIWHAGNLFYALSTWGLALAGLYRS